MNKTHSVFFKLGVSFAVFFFGLLVADHTLAFFNVPAHYVEAVAHPPNFHQVRQTIDFTYRFDTNSYGLRYREIPAEKPANTRRIFVTGDSYVEGFGVDADKTFVSLLEKEFSTPEHPVEFINAGLSGTGPLEYGRIFHWVGQRLHPNVLLICPSANDISNTSRSTEPSDIVNIEIKPVNWRSRLLMWLFPHIRVEELRLRDQLEHKEETQTNDLLTWAHVAAKKKGIPEETYNAWKAKIDLKLVDAVNRGQYSAYWLTQGLLRPHYWTDTLDIDRPVAETRYQNLEKLMDSIVDEAQRSGIAVGIVYVPVAFQFDPIHFSKTVPSPLRSEGSILREGWLTETSEFQRRLSAWASRRSIPYMDLTPALRERTRAGHRMTFKYDGHFNPDGHELVAGELSRWLKRTGLCDAGKEQAKK